MRRTIQVSEAVNNRQSRFPIARDRRSTFETQFGRLLSILRRLWRMLAHPFLCLASGKLELLETSFP